MLERRCNQTFQRPPLPLISAIVTRLITREDLLQSVAVKAPNLKHFDYIPLVLVVWQPTASHTGAFATDGNPLKRGP